MTRSMRQRARPPRPILAAVLALLIALMAFSFAFAPRADAYVYWADWRDGASWISRADLDGSGFDPDFVSLPSPHAAHPQVSAIAVNDTHIYWAGSRSSAKDTIGRARLDGTKLNKRLVSGVPLAAGAIAVDDKHIYWTNLADDAIGRANLDGAGVDPDFIAAPGGQSGSELNHGVAVDDKHIYWTTSIFYSGGSGTVGRADLDGTQVDAQFISGISPTGGIAVDVAHIYWTQLQPNRRDGTIARSNLDGSGVESLISIADFVPANVAVDDKHVYWTAYHYFRGGGGIDRANLDGTGVDDFMIAGGGNSLGRVLIVDALGRRRVTGTANARRTQRERGQHVLIKVEVRAREHLTVEASGEIKLARSYKLKPESAELMERIRTTDVRTKTLKLEA